ncbi:hypothetical protein E2562_013298 [Oryza meyeriana var. granulata]|uniref:Uncharacterized protein n=1 Tax=Oryza meyeriana var. granulata TaxID=110450 RepID=A0A6G1D469_9ORYZ|nr:hypothetical protein E2562_013298 [Oryza meyeriana var. granulata]
MPPPANSYMYYGSRCSTECGASASASAGVGGGCSDGSLSSLSGYSQTTAEFTGYVDASVLHCGPSSGGVPAAAVIPQLPPYHHGIQGQCIYGDSKDTAVHFDAHGLGNWHDELMINNEIKIGAPDGCRQE